MYLPLVKNNPFQGHKFSKLFALIILFLCTFSTGCVEGIFHAAREEPTSSESFELYPAQTQVPGQASSTPAEEISTGTITAAPSTSVQPSATPLAQLARTHYILTAFLDYDHHHIKIFETISYINKTNTQLDELALVLEPEYQSDDFQLNALTWQDGSGVNNYTLEDGLLRLDLEQPLDPGNVTEMDMEFEYSLPDTPGSFGYSPRQVNLTDWYARIPPYSPETGWMVFEPGDVGEHTMYDMADYEVEIQPIGTVKDMVVAASAPQRKVGNIYHFQRELARNFSFSASPEYQVVYDAHGNTPILGYVFPEHTQAGIRAASYVREALEVFSELFGSYDLPSITLVESEFPDGLEYDGLFFLSQSFFANDNESAQSMLCFLSVHETAHQWWYRVVANNQAIQPWLDEAFSTYSEILFYEQRYPQLVPWWWDYRINQYRPQGWINSSIYDFHEDRPYINAVYLRGARFLDELRTHMGEEAFQQFLQDYITQEANQMTDEGTFFQVLSEHNPGVILDLIEEYFNQ
jgi:hypothetical protein